MAHTIVNPKKIQKKSTSHEVTPTARATRSYRVVSGTSHKAYYVQIMQQGAICSCDWAKYRPAMDRRSACSHVVSVFNYIEEEKSRRVSAWTSEPDAARQHKPKRDIGDGVWLTSRKLA